jgi:hypothetical protein
VAAAPSRSTPPVRAKPACKATPLVRAAPPAESGVQALPARSPTPELRDEIEEERQDAEGMSQTRDQEMVEMARQENVLLRTQLREEAGERERLLQVRDALKAQLVVLGDTVDETIRAREAEREEGEIYEEEGEEEMEVDDVRHRSWIAQLLTEHNKNKPEEDDGRWIKIGKQKSANQYLKNHWQTWVQRDIDTDKSRVEALLGQYTALGGYPKTFAEILKSLSDIKLELITGLNKCNEVGREQPHAAFSNLVRMFISLH